MLKRIRFVGKFNLNLLSEELFAVFPGWVFPGFEGRPTTTAKVIADPAGVSISYDPATTNETTLNSIVAAHDWKAKSRNEKDQEKYKKDSLSGKIKLLGLGFSPAEIDALTRKA